MAMKVFVFCMQEVRVRRRSEQLSASLVSTLFWTAIFSLLTLDSIVLYADQRQIPSPDNPVMATIGIAPRYAVIDLGTNLNPIKITDSGDVLGIAPGLVSAGIWKQGSWSPLNPSSVTLGMLPTDIGEDGTVVGIANDEIFNTSLDFGYGFYDPVSLAIWPPGSSTNTLVDPTIYTNTGSYINGGEANTVSDIPTDYSFGYGTTASILISSNHIWSIQIANSGGMIDGFQSSHDGSTPVEMGLITDSGGTAVFPLAANNSGMCLKETDYSYQVGPLGGSGYYFPSSTTYSVDNHILPSGLTPSFGLGVLSNTNSLGGFYLIVSNAVLTNGNPNFPNPSQYYCWDGTNKLVLPQPPGSVGITVAPNGINAATTTLTSSNSSQIVPATQVIGGGSIWSMIPSTNNPPTFGSPENLTALLYRQAATNPTWLQTHAASLNDFGAIVGTATYSGTNTAIPAGSHGVLLIPCAEKLLNGDQTSNDVDGIDFFGNRPATRDYGYLATDNTTTANVVSVLGTNSLGILPLNNAYSSGATVNSILMESKVQPSNSNITYSWHRAYRDNSVTIIHSGTQWNVASVNSASNPTQESNDTGSSSYFTTAVSPLNLLYYADAPGANLPGFFNTCQVGDFAYEQTDFTYTLTINVGTATTTSVVHVGQVIIAKRIALTGSIQSQWQVQQNTITTTNIPTCQVTTGIVDSIVGGTPTVVIPATVNENLYQE